MTEQTRCLDPLCEDGPSEDGTPLPRWAHEPALLCNRCMSLLEQRLVEMKAHHDDVARTMLTSLPSRAAGDNKPTKGSPPVELNLAAHDWIINATATLASWTRLVCEERDLRGPDRSEVGPLSTYLYSQFPWLTAHGAVGDFADEIRDLTRAAETIAGKRLRWHRLPAPCPSCQAQELGRWDGASEVQCASCDSAWPESDYPRLVMMLTYEKSVTAAEGAARAGVEAATFRQWVSRGRVRRLGTVEGQARYSVDDVEAVRRDEGVA